MSEARADLISDTESERRIMLLASELARPAWERVEKAYARGATLDEAKQSVLDADVTRLADSTESPVLDRLVQLVMQTPHSGLRPAARQKHRKIILERLSEPCLAAGLRPPGPFAGWLYRKFGLVPAGVRAFHKGQGRTLGRVI